MVSRDIPELLLRKRVIKSMKSEKQAQTLRDSLLVQLLEASAIP